MVPIRSFSSVFRAARYTSTPGTRAASFRRLTAGIGSTSLRSTRHQSRRRSWSSRTPSGTWDAIGESHDGEWPPPLPDEIPDPRSEIEESGLFDRVEVRRYLWETTYTAEQYIALLNTFSGHIAIDTEKRTRLYREIRDRISHRPEPKIRRHGYAILHVARRAIHLPRAKRVETGGEAPGVPHGRRSPEGSGRGSPTSWGRSYGRLASRPSFRTQTGGLSTFQQ